MSMRSRLLLMFAAVSLLAAACNSSSDQPALCNAATDLAVVNGAAITCDDLYRFRPEYGDLDLLAEGELVRGDLTRLIQDEVFRTTAAQEFGITIGDADIAERLANPPARWAPLLTQQLAERESRSNALRSIVSDLAAPEVARADYGGLSEFAAQRPQDVVRVCVRTILVLSESEAVAVVNRLDAGEDFLAVRNEVSIENSLPDGLLVDSSGSCPVYVGALGEQFALAAALTPIGEIAGPVPDESGVFHVIRVEERIGPATSSDLETDFLDFLDPGAQSVMFSRWATDAVREADVDVASPIGRWAPASLGIVPPGFNVSGG